MNPTRYVIDDSDRVRPHIRLCHRLLAEALVNGYGTVELVSPPGEMPGARAGVDGAWKPLMAFPSAVHDSLIGYLKEMADLPPGSQVGTCTIQVRLADVDASITVSARRNDQGLEELTLHFPEAKAG
jgi:hypothetical protein